jgi:hypothetical protein
MVAIPKDALTLTVLASMDVFRFTQMNLVEKCDTHATPASDGVEII